MKTLLIRLALPTIALLMLNGCNTVAGAGKDLQKAGQSIEHQAEKI